MLPEFLNPPFLWISYGVVFAFGASIGSFYGNLTYRIVLYFYSPLRKRYSPIDRWKKALVSPSVCENCNQKLKWWEIIPIFGFFFSKGKCYRCGYPIPFSYPILEFGMGILGILVFFLTSHFLVTLLFLILSGHLLISSITDYRFYSLDYENLGMIVLWGILWNFFFLGEFPQWEDYLTLAGFFGFFLVLHLFYPRGIGFGDVLFAPAFAFLSTHPWWLFFLNSSYLLAIVFSFLFRKPGKPFTKTPIPMGMYLCIGFFLTNLARLVYYKYGIQLDYE